MPAYLPNCITFPEAGSTASAKERPGSLVLQYISVSGSVTSARYGVSLLRS